jgi:hemerythrin-like metal-binding protein
MDWQFRDLIKWNPSLSVGIESIDSQHQLLVTMIRHLQQAMLEGRAREVVSPLFVALNQYTQFHFQYEEQLLRDHQYTKVTSHCEIHKGLITQLHELEAKYASGKLTAGAPLMQFLRTWLMDHISAHDQAYASFLKEKGVT